MHTEELVCTAEDIYGTTWGLFESGAYGWRFGSASPWRRAKREEIAESIVEFLNEGGDEAEAED